MTITLMAANVFAFLFLFAIWKKSDIANLVLKITFLLFTVANGVALANALGYIVKVAS